MTRWLSNPYSEQVWASAKPLIRRAEQPRGADEFAGLIVDDSILEKGHTDPRALICPLKDHRPGRFVRGLNFVRLLYQAGTLALPRSPARQVARRAPASLHAFKGQVKVHFFHCVIGQAGIELRQRLGSGQYHLLAGLPVQGQRYLVLVAKLHGLEHP